MALSGPKINPRVIKVSDTTDIGAIYAEVKEAINKALEGVPSANEAEVKLQALKNKLIETQKKIASSTNEDDVAFNKTIENHLTELGKIKPKEFNGETPRNLAFNQTTQMAKEIHEFYVKLFNKEIEEAEQKKLAEEAAEKEAEEKAKAARVVPVIPKTEKAEAEKKLKEELAKQKGPQSTIRASGAAAGGAVSSVGGAEEDKKAAPLTPEEKALDEVTKAAEGASASTHDFDTAIEKNVALNKKWTPKEKDYEAETRKNTGRREYEATQAYPVDSKLKQATQALQKTLAEKLGLPADSEAARTLVKPLDDKLGQVHQSVVNNRQPLDKENWKNIFNEEKARIEKVIDEKIPDAKKNAEAKEALKTELQKMQTTTAKEHFDDVRLKQKDRAHTQSLDLLSFSSGQREPVWEFKGPLESNYKEAAKLGDGDDELSLNTRGGEFKAGYYHKPGSLTTLKVEADPQDPTGTRKIVTPLPYKQEEDFGKLFAKRLAAVYLSPVIAAAGVVATVGWAFLKIFSKIPGMSKFDPGDHSNITNFLTPISQRDYYLKQVEKVQKDVIDCCVQHGTKSIPLSLRTRSEFLEAGRVDMDRLNMQLKLVEQAQAAGKTMGIDVSKEQMEALAKEFTGDKIGEFEAVKNRIEAINRGAARLEEAAKKRVEERRVKEAEPAFQEKQGKKEIQQHKDKFENAQKLDQYSGKETPAKLESFLKSGDTAATINSIKSEIKSSEARLKTLQAAEQTLKEKIPNANPEKAANIQQELQDLRVQIEREAGALKERGEVMTKVLNEKETDLTAKSTSPTETAEAKAKAAEQLKTVTDLKNPANALSTGADAALKSSNEKVEQMNKAVEKAQAEEKAKEEAAKAAANAPAQQKP